MEMAAAADTETPPVGPRDDVADDSTEAEDVSPSDDSSTASVGNDAATDDVSDGAETDDSLSDDDCNCDGACNCGAHLGGPAIDNNGITSGDSGIDPPGIDINKVKIEDEKKPLFVEVQRDSANTTATRPSILEGNVKNEELKSEPGDICAAGPSGLSMVDFRFKKEELKTEEIDLAEAGDVYAAGPSRLPMVDFRLKKEELKAEIDQETGACEGVAAADLPFFEVLDTNDNTNNIIQINDSDSDVEEVEVICEYYIEEVNE